MLRKLGIILLMALTTSFAVSAEKQRRIDNLEAFGKAYGYVKYFYPSDEASRVDWNKFLVHGIESVQVAKDEEELVNILNSLFKPIAPEIIFSKGEIDFILERDFSHNSGLFPIYWQHLGKGGPNSNVYKSKRVGRELLFIKEDKDYANLMQAIEIDKYRGHKFQLVAKVRVSKGSKAQLWARIDLENNTTGFFDNMSDRPIIDSKWREYTISGVVDNEAKRMVFGLMLDGDNKAWLDQLNLRVLSVKGKWLDIPINNSKMEEWGNSKLDGWYSHESAYTPSKVNNDSGLKGVQVYLGPQYDKIEASQKLFEQSLDANIVIQKKLVGSVFINMPLVVLGDSKSTFPSAKAEASILNATLSSQNVDINAQHTQLADVFVLWNSIQHFYPYFEEVNVDWQLELKTSISTVGLGQTKQEHERLLNQMVAGFQDGHGRVFNPSSHYLVLPFLLDFIEGEVVVVKSNDVNLKRGDIVKLINDKPVLDELNRVMNLTSGSKQWKVFRALELLRQSTERKHYSVTVNRNGGTIKFSGEYGRDYNITNKKYQPIEDFGQNVFYIDLERASMPDIEATLDSLITAKGVIFDLRGYPNSNHKIISHLLTQPDNSTEWMKVPRIVYPDNEFAAWESYNWMMPVEEPNLKGKIVFLTNSNAISYSESFLSFIKHYSLGTIIGQPTAGTNGNINYINLPSGLEVIFTGMKVTKHDGSQLHLKGIMPDISVNKTIKAVLEGRDEYVEKAIAYIEDEDG